jgi:hypothetical protein
MRLVKSQYEAILRRAAMYDDQDWDNTTKDNRAQMNLALDLRDCRKALGLALPILEHELKVMLSSFTVDGYRSMMDAQETKWVTETETALEAVRAALK